MKSFKQNAPQEKGVVKMLKMLSIPFEFTVEVFTKGAHVSFMFVVGCVLIAAFTWFFNPALAQKMLIGTVVLAVCLLIAHGKLVSYKMFSSKHHLVWKCILCLPTVCVLSLGFFLMADLPIWSIPALYLISGIASVFWGTLSS